MASRAQGTARQEATPPEDVQQEVVHLRGGRSSLGVGLQGLPSRAPALLAFHPRRQLLVAATAGGALAEYDALTGARRHLTELPGSPLRVAFTPDGGTVVVVTRERTMYSWNTTTWRRRLLLPLDPKYANKKLTAGLMAVSGGQQPIVYWTPVGKNTVRTVHLAAPAAAKGTKLDREFVPGLKLKTENKKPIVGLAVHPFDRHTIFVLLADGSLQLCGVGGAAVATLHTLPVPMKATEERVGLHAWPHPKLPGGALVAVEASVSGVTVVEAAPRQEPRVLGTLSFGAGSTICGVSLLHNNLLCAAGRHASGNVQIRAWRLAGDSRELQVLPTTALPSTVWDALQGGALADVCGDNTITRAHFHPPTGLLALSTALRAPREGEAGDSRVPLLQLLDGADPAGAPRALPLHSGLGFWTSSDQGSVVSKLRFPRYAHVVSDGKVASYDLTHGMLSDVLVLPPANEAGQERSLARVVRSTRQGGWLAVMRVLSRQRDGAAAGGGQQPGQQEFSYIKDGQAAITAGQWFMPGVDCAFVGGRDELVVVLANSGQAVSVFETTKLQAGAKPLYRAELKEGPVAALYPGPPAHIPAPPQPHPEPEEHDGSDSDVEEAALRDWEQQEQRRLELPRQLLLLTADNRLCLVDVSSSSTSYASAARALPARHQLALRPSEAVVQVGWQALADPAGGFHTGSEGASGAVAAVAAVLTSERVLLLSERLEVVSSASVPPDMGVPASCLWLGPALLVSTSSGQVLQLGWDGALLHTCSLLGGPPTLLGALGDRLLVASLTGSARCEVATRGFSVLQPMLLGWATLAARRVLPGGMQRVHQAVCALVASYDASHVSLDVLQRLASAGFADVAAAVAAKSESPAVTPAHKAVFTAAGGNWQPVLELVMAEWEKSAFHPHPPPKCSPLASKLVALARCCEQYGRFGDARRLLEAAGAHNELLALCVFQGDFLGMQSYAREGGRDVERLADQLAAVNENAFRRGAANSIFGGRPNVDDWVVEAGVPAAVDVPAPFAGSEGRAAADSEEEDGMEIEVESGAESGIKVAPAGRLPAMEASLQVMSAAAPVPASDEEEGQPIEPLDLSALDAYVGVVGATVLRPATPLPGSSAAAAAATPVLARVETNASDFSNAQEEAAAARVASGWESDGEGGPSTTGPAGAAATPGQGETTAQAAARAEYKREATMEDEDDFFSSDEESGPVDADARSVTSLSTTASAGRFRIAIKAADETPRQMADVGALRLAAQSLRLGSVAGSESGTPFASSRSFGRVDSTPTSSAAAAQAGKPAPTQPLAMTSQPSTDTTSSVSDDPFADLAGLPAPSPAAQAQPTPTVGVAPGASKPAPPPPPPAQSGGTPMRPQPQPAAAQSNLTLEGWDQFEALFFGGSAGPAAAAPAPVRAPPPMRPPPMAPVPVLPKPGAAGRPAPARPGRSDSSVAAFQAGTWGEAVKLLRGLEQQRRPGAPSGPQLVHLYTSARLLQAAATSGRSSAAAKLARYAAALELGPQERAAASAAAVDANLAAGNYGYCAQQLAALAVSTAGLAGPPGGMDPHELQDKLNVCDRAGGRNSSVPGDEDLESFSAIVGSLGSCAEADEVLQNLLQSTP